jgi:hypothetical protein
MAAPVIFPLNYSAKQTLEFFRSGIRSRMARSPWQGDRLVLRMVFHPTGLRYMSHRAPSEWT